MLTDLESLRKLALEATPGQRLLLPLSGKYYGTIVRIPCRPGRRGYEFCFWDENHISMPEDISDREIADHGSAQAVMDDHLGWNHCENRFDLAEARFIAALNPTVVLELIARCEAAERVVEALRSVLSEDGVREYLSCFVMGVEAMDRLAAYDHVLSGKGKA